jgi:hypothetical protein
MSLTIAQKGIINKAYESLKQREPVFLSGTRNGKTYSMYRLIEATDTMENRISRDEHKLTRSRRGDVIKRHAEDPELVFLEHVRFPRVDRMSTESVMRQVLQACGFPLSIRSMNVYEIRKAFVEALYAARESNEVYCLAIDNAENLPERAYTIIKEINELRHRGKDIGLSVAISGYYEKMKMPYWFHDMCHEIVVAKISDIADIRTFIENTYPAQAHLFGPAAIRQLQRCQTTGLMRKAIRQMVTDIQEGYAEEVKDLDLGKLVDKNNERYAIAA